ncbi:carboxypeptidase-like regulatory domain-containing protein [Deminuibacter soli]|uniref:Carboxypeptidase-like regulatory domain-containing protein n=1 Tax=Deminuibacter soli TaxID=2291815 RepID=A0A3E1NKZ7_9BACT|nr:carboxypeptidase-like regulatory domain-containing protein [Deminuibacter soli]RFM28603.1 carboxypeptidase-like regulatory domain-containing protein [Deminuibacter soli]
MAEQYNHNEFSLADIERYLQGRMPAKEMHELEKAALNDPFLADAMEGFAQVQLPIAQQHLNNIAAALQRPAQVKVLPVYKRRTWLRVAAAVILIAGAGTGALLLQNKPSPTQAPELATITKNTTPPVVQDSIRADKSGSPKPAAEPAVIRRKPAPQVFSKPQPQQPVTASAPVVAAAEAPPAPAAKQPAAVTAMAAPAEYDKVQTDTVIHGNMGFTAARKATMAAPMQAAPGKVYQLEGIVRDEQQKPLENATIKPINGKALAMTDEDGRFVLRSNDSITSVTVSSLGYASAEVTIKANKTNSVQLEESQQSLGDMVVTELRSRSKKAAASGNAVKQATPDATPAGGWQMFQQYVYTKLHKEIDTTASEEPLPGDIEMEFEINDKGKPYNFVIRSTPSETDSQAIDAIRNGPKWITSGPEKKKKVTVHIK